MPDEIDWLTDSVPQPSDTDRTAARARQVQLLKPPGALGVLEELVVQLAGLQATPLPCANVVPIVVFAGDHGVAAHNVSAYPPSVTVDMLGAFVGGGAAIAVMARELGLKLSIIDAGTLSELPIAGVITDKPRCGSRDFTAGAAMTDAETAHALAARRRAVTRASKGADLIILGEMGIANTTVAAAVAAAILGQPVSSFVGAGTGLDTAGIAHKQKIITRGLEANGLVSGNAAPLTILARVGGPEIAALTGAIIASAQMRLPVLVDGFIVSVAALAACRLVPGVRDWLIFAHLSAEQGHAAVLEALNAAPIATFRMRLGEGSGAAAVLPTIRLACALHRDMGTLAEAGVTKSTEG